MDDSSRYGHEGIRAALEYLRSGFPGVPIGHRPHGEEDYLFFIGPTEQQSVHRLLVKFDFLTDNRPLSLMVKLRDSEVEKLLREAGPEALRLPVR